MPIELHICQPSHLQQHFWQYISPYRLQICRLLKDLYRKCPPSMSSHAAIHMGYNLPSCQPSITYRSTNYKSARRINQKSCGRIDPIGAMGSITVLIISSLTCEIPTSFVCCVESTIVSTLFGRWSS